MAGQKILVVEPNRELGELIQEVLTSLGYFVVTAAHGRNGREVLQRERIDFVYTSLAKSDETGFPLLKWMKANYPDIPIAVSSAMPTKEEEKEAVLLGAVQYIKKPFSFPDLAEVISKTLNKMSNFQPSD